MTQKKEKLPKHIPQIPSAISKEFENVLIHITTIRLSQSVDTLEWRIPGLARRIFSSSEVYNSIREARPLVRWHLVIWFKRGILKHKSLAWMVLLNRCSTRDRLLSRGLQTDPLCNLTAVSRNHLFFTCPYSMSIWTTLASNLRLILHVNSWETTLDALIDFAGTNSLKYLTLLAWQACIFELWRERNDRLHQGTRRPSRIIPKRIDATVRNRISSFRSQNDQAASHLLQLWFSLN